MVQKFVYYLFIIPLFFYSCKAKKDEPKFELNAYITGMFAGTAYLSKYVDGQLIVVDSAEIRKFKFKFKGHLPNGPEMYYIRFLETETVMEFFLENSKIQIDADILKLKNAKIKGSKSQKEYQDFLDNNAAFENKQKDLYRQFKLAELNKDTSLFAQYEADYSAVFTEQTEFIKQFVNQNTESVAALFVATRSLASLISDEELEQITEKFNTSQPRSVYTKELNNQLFARKRTAINQLAPDFKLPNITKENPVALKDFTGKTVLLTFWMPKVGDSRAQNKFYKTLYKKYKGKDFQIVSVAFSTDKNYCKTVISADSLNWVQLSDFKGINSPIRQLYDVRSLNNSFLIDKSGIILDKNFTNKKLEDYLENMFTPQ